MVRYWQNTRAGTPRSGWTWRDICRTGTNCPSPWTTATMTAFIPKRRTLPFTFWQNHCAQGADGESGLYLREETGCGQLVRPGRIRSGLLLCLRHPGRPAGQSGGRSHREPDDGKGRGLPGRRGGGGKGQSRPPAHAGQDDADQPLKTGGEHWGRNDKTVEPRLTED